ncbi:hypothetical protein OQA88_19 [Cercophora sp. LCS_1]
MSLQPSAAIPDGVLYVIANDLMQELTNRTLEGHITDRAVSHARRFIEILTPLVIGNTLPTAETIRTCGLYTTVCYIVDVAAVLTPDHRAQEMKHVVACAKSLVKLFETVLLIDMDSVDSYQVGAEDVTAIRQDRERRRERLTPRFEDASAVARMERERRVPVPQLSPAAVLRDANKEDEERENKRCGNCEAAKKNEVAKGWLWVDQNGDGKELCRCAEGGQRDPAFWL